MKIANVGTEHFGRFFLESPFTYTLPSVTSTIKLHITSISQLQTQKWANISRHLHKVCYKTEHNPGSFHERKRVLSRICCQFLNCSIASNGKIINKDGTGRIHKRLDFCIWRHQFSLVANRKIAGNQNKPSYAEIWIGDFINTKMEYTVMLGKKWVPYT